MLWRDLRVEGLITLSGTDLAALILAGVSLSVVGLVVWLVFELRRMTEELRKTLERFRLQVDTVLTHAELQAEGVEAELCRVGGLLDVAERVSNRAEKLSQMTYGAVVKPIIKTAAVVKGTSRAARRLRRGSNDDYERPTS